MPSENAATTVEPMQGFAADLGGLVASFLSSPWVIFILVPLLVTVGSVLLKAFSRQEFFIKPEDKVVGFDLGITACITLLVSSLVLVNKRTAITPADAALVQHYLIGIFVVFIFFVAMLVLAAAFFRRKAWKKEADGKVAVNRMWFWGVNLTGLFLLVVAFSLTGGTFT